MISLLKTLVGKSAMFMAVNRDRWRGTVVRVHEQGITGMDGVEIEVNGIPVYLLVRNIVAVSDVGL